MMHFYTFRSYEYVSMMLDCRKKKQFKYIYVKGRNEGAQQVWIWLIFFGQQEWKNILQLSL